MNSLSEKEKLILWIEEGQRNIEMACRLVENGKPGEALGLMHAELSRTEDKRIKLCMEAAQEREDKRERAEQEFLF